MRRPILLDNPPPRPLPSVRWSPVLETRFLSVGGLAAGGVAAVVGASLVLAMLMAPDVSARAGAGASVAVAPPAASAGGLQYVGDVKQPDRPCEEQTWPYIAAHCLKPASGPKPATVKVAVDRADIKASRVAKPAPVATQAVAAAPVAEPAVVQPAIVPSAAPEAAVPAAGPRQAVRTPSGRDAQPKRSRSAARATPIELRPEFRPDTRAEARRAYASDRYPPGIRSQSIHQAAAFTAER